MALTQQDLRLYASQRLTDTPDGGGLMTNTPLTGADNELFPPISDVDNTMGALDARLVYAATLRDDDTALYGANVVLSSLPNAPNVSNLLMKADYYGQMRGEFMERVEGYRVPTVETRYTLLGTQRKGSRIVQMYARTEAALPVVGQTFALRVFENALPVYEFVRVERIESSLQTFEDEKGEFVRRVIKIVITEALERDFVGVEEASRYKATPDARVLDTQIADAAQYYGIAPVSKALTQGDSSLHVASLMKQLVPVSTVETALADDWAQGKSLYLPLSAPQTWFVGSSNRAIYLPFGVLPGSVQIDGWTDDAQGSLQRGDERATVDYAQGVIQGVNYVSKVTATPAVQVRNHAYSSTVQIDDTNVGTEWSLKLSPKPARGATQIAFMHGGEWLELEDVGDYVLRDASGKTRGHITASGSAVVSLPALPDSGSQLLASWVPDAFYKTWDDGDVGSVITPQTVDTRLSLMVSAPIVPNSLRLTWAGGSARDDGAGKLTGDCSGSVDYVSGEIAPVGLNAANVQAAYRQYSATATSKSVAVADGGSEMSLIVGKLQAGSLRIELVTTLQTVSGYKVKNPRWWSHFWGEYDWS